MKHAGGRILPVKKLTTGNSSIILNRGKLASTKKSSVIKYHTEYE